MPILTQRYEQDEASVAFAREFTTSKCRIDAEGSLWETAYQAKTQRQQSIAKYICVNVS